MTILVTGGAGFIGSHLCQRLIGRGRRVVAVDNLSTGRRSNIAHLERQQGFEFIEGDIADSHLMEELAGRCEVIYHLAAAVGVSLIADRPVHTIETNIGGTEVVLDAANKYHRRILLASSSEIYGKNESIPFDEQDDIVLGNTRLSRWSYACSKAIDEFLAFAFYEQYGLEVIIGRFFNTIGPRQRGEYGMVVPRFVQSALKGEPLRIYGTGRQSRCFCYVQDLVDAIIGLMNSDKAVGEVFNIGSVEEVSIEELADKVIAICAGSNEKQYISYEKAYGKPIGDMMRRVPDISKITKTIGWEPKTGLDETLGIIAKSFGGSEEQ